MFSFSSRGRHHSLGHARSLNINILFFSGPNKMGANVLFRSLCTLTVVTLSNRHDSSADCACFNCSFGVEDCLGPKFLNEPGSALSAWSVPFSPFSQRLFVDRRSYFLRRLSPSFFRRSSFTCALSAARPVHSLVARLTVDACF